MNEEKIIEMYKNSRYTLRHLSEIFGTDHHKIKRILIKNGVRITRRNTLKEFSQAHKDKISDSRKRLYASGAITTWSKGREMSDDFKLKNLKTHLSFKVSMDWLKQFKDIEKLKLLNYSIRKKEYRKNWNEETYKKYIELFYYNDQFNKIYNKWLLSDKEKWLKPSIDHINSISNKCVIDDLDNWQFLTWIENRAKFNMSQEEWNKIKNNLSDYFI